MNTGIVADKNKLNVKKDDTSKNTKRTHVNEPLICYYMTRPGIEPETFNFVA